MPFPYDRYPWLNFQELNLAYFIKHFREIFQEWNTLYHDLTEWKDATDTELDEWRTTTMAGLDAWRALTLEHLETSISGWETDTLTALDAWKAAFEAEYAALKAEVEGIRDQAAADAAAAALSAGAAETAQAAAEAAAASVQSSAAQITANTADIANLMETVPQPVLTWNPGFINSEGEVSTSSYSRLTDIVPCYQGGKVLTTVTPQHQLICYIATYNAGGFKERVGLASNPDYTIPDDVTGFRILFGRLSQSGIPFDDATDFSYLAQTFYLKPESYQDAEAYKAQTAATMAAMAAETAADVGEINDKIDFLSKDVPDMFVYTDYDPAAGFWRENGTLTSNLTHTQLFPIIPGGKLYTANQVNQESQGAFFDAFGRWLSPVRRSEMSTFSYPAPNRGTATFSYATFYEFTAPENAYYISLNITSNTDLSYKNYIASKPVFPNSGTGNIIVKNDAAYEQLKTKKLCVIGASMTAIDRASRTQLNNDFVCGWQEYVFPWYAYGETFGFNGGPMGDISAHTDVYNYISIYQGIIQGAVDLSGFDEFLIFATKNALSYSWYNVGDWGTVDDPTVDVTTYMGGLRALCEYIQAQNPLAKIYLTTIHNYGNYFSSPGTVRPKTDSINAKTREMAEKLGLNLIDLALTAGFNAHNYYDPNDASAKYTYDGTHLNQKGSVVIGTAIRKAIVGY